MAKEEQLFMPTAAEQALENLEVNETCHKLKFLEILQSVDAALAGKTRNWK